MVGNSKSEFHKPTSISSRRRRFAVAGSPFNGIKVAVVVLLLGGFPLWWAVDALVRTPLAQLMILGGYGLTGMGWVIIRTGRVVRGRPPGRVDAAMGAMNPAAAAGSFVGKGDGQE